MPVVREGQRQHATGHAEGRERVAAQVLQLVAATAKLAADGVEAERVLRRGAGIPAHGQHRAGVVAESAIQRVELDIRDRDVVIENDRVAFGVRLLRRRCRSTPARRSPA